MKVWKAVKLILGIIEGTVIALILGSFILLKLCGLESFVVLSGSMQPTLNIDDLVFIQQADIASVEKNDIIIFKENNSYVTHRAVDIENNNGKIEITTKGDHNNTEDREKVTSSNFYGKYYLSIPHGGVVLNFVQSPFGLVLIVSVPVITILISSVVDYVYKMKRDDNTVSD